jgi:hypothetical protein
MPSDPLRMALIVRHQTALRPSQTVFTRAFMA